MSGGPGEQAAPADPYPVGSTALVVLVPEADARVGAFRRRYDASAGRGVGAHVTVLVPFVPADRLGDADLGRLETLVRRLPAFDVRFARTDRFPGTVYLVPEPARPFAVLTHLVLRAWPGLAPYGGQHPDVVPHLTVAGRLPATTLDAVESLVAPQLPVSARVTAVTLLEREPGGWVERRRLPLGPALDLPAAP